MENYGNNSDKARVEKKEIAPVAKGVIKKKTILDYIKAPDTNTIVGYLTSSVIEVIKDGAYDVLIESVNAVFGRTTNTRKRMGSKASYKDYYEDNRRRNDSWSESKKTSNNQIRVDDITFDERGEAEKVLDALYEALGRYPTVSVADFYEFASVPNDNYTANNYGWDNLTGSRIIRTRDGYVVRLPKPFPLEK